MNWIYESAVSEDITDAQYFEDAPWKDYISNSKLNLLDPTRGGSMALFLRSWKNEKRSKSLQHGTIVHSLLLQADAYGVSDIIRPSGKLGDMVYDLFRLRNRDNSVMPLKEAIELLLKLHNYYSGKPSPKILKNAIKSGIPYYKHLMIYRNNDFILNSEEVDIVLGCLESIKANDACMNTLFPKDPDILRFNEQAMSVGIEVEDKYYTLKVKVDNWTLDLKNQVATLNDLKTSSSNLDNFVEGYWEVYPTSNDVIRIFHPGSFQKYSYFRQMAMYAKVLEMYVANTYGFIPRVDINIIAVETRDPFRSELFNFGTYEDGKFSMNQLEFGFNQTEELLLTLAKNGYVQTIGGINIIPQAFI